MEAVSVQGIATITNTGTISAGARGVSIDGAGNVVNSGLISGAIGVYHAGVEAKIFQGFTTCTANATAGTTAELLKQISHAPLIRCDQVQFRFLGISMAGWNAILSLSGAALILLLTLKPKRA